MTRQQSAICISFALNLTLNWSAIIPLVLLTSWLAPGMMDNEAGDSHRFPVLLLAAYGILLLISLIRSIRMFQRLENPLLAAVFSVLLLISCVVPTWIYFRIDEIAANSGRG